MICQRCLKDTQGVHTCSPTPLVRRLEALIRLQHEALKSFEGDHWYQENAGEALAAYEAFEKGGE